MIYLLCCRAANEAAVRHRHASASCRAVPSADVLSPLVPDPLLRRLRQDHGGFSGTAPLQQRCRGCTAASLSRCRMSVKCNWLRTRVAISTLASAWGEQSHKQPRDPQSSCLHPTSGCVWKSLDEAGEGGSRGATLAGVSALRLRAKQLTAAFWRICFERNTVIRESLRAADEPTESGCS